MVSKMEEPLEDVLNSKPIIVLDTGPLFTAISGFPFNVLTATSFVLNDYRKARSIIKNRRLSDNEKIARLKGFVMENLKRKEEAGEHTIKILFYCMQNPGRCLVPEPVIKELRKYMFEQEMRQFLQLLGNDETRKELVKWYNNKMERIGRGPESEYKEEIRPELFEKILGSEFDWRKPLVSQLSLDKLFRDWLDAVEFRGHGLSRTDKIVLALTGYLNNNGKPAVAVIADRAMSLVADELGIPYYYVYSNEVRNADKLASLSLTRTAGEEKTSKTEKTSIAKSYFSTNSLPK